MTDDLRSARELFRFIRGDWLPGTWSVEARRFVPSLLLGLYVADREGRRLTKREASALMNADTASSGPKYIRLAELAGLITVDRKASEDRRKDFIQPTPEMISVVEQELGALAEKSAVGVSEDPQLQAAPAERDMTAFVKAASRRFFNGRLTELYEEGRRIKALPARAVRNGVITDDIVFVPFGEVQRTYIGGPEVKTRANFDDGKTRVLVRFLHMSVWRTPTDVEFWALPKPAGWTDFDVYGNTRPGDQPEAPRRRKARSSSAERKQ